jgi:hypothetical protein
MDHPGLLYGRRDPPLFTEQARGVSWHHCSVNL